MKIIAALAILLLVAAMIGAVSRIEKLEARVSKLEPHRHRPGFVLEQAGL